MSDGVFLLAWFGGSMAVWAVAVFSAHTLLMRRARRDAERRSAFERRIDAQVYRRSYP